MHRLRYRVGNSHCTPETLISEKIEGFRFSAGMLIPTCLITYRLPQGWTHIVENMAVSHDKILREGSNEGSWWRKDPV